MTPLLLRLYLAAALVIVCHNCTVAQMPKGEPLLRDRLKLAEAEVDACRKELGEINAAIKAVADSLDDIEPQYAAAERYKAELDALGGLIRNAEVSVSVRLSALAAVHSRLQQDGAADFAEMVKKVDAAEERAAKLSDRIGKAKKVVEILANESKEADPVVNLTALRLKDALDALKVPPSGLSIFRDALLFVELTKSVTPLLHSWPASDGRNLVEKAFGTLETTAGGNGLHGMDMFEAFSGVRKRLSLASKRFPELVDQADVRTALNEILSAEDWSESAADDYFADLQKYFLAAGRDAIIRELRDFLNTMRTQFAGLTPVERANIVPAFVALEDAAAGLASRMDSYSKNDLELAMTIAKDGQLLNTQELRKKLMGDAAVPGESLRTAATAAIELHRMNAFEALRYRIEATAKKRKAANEDAESIVRDASQLHSVDLRLATIQSFIEIQSSADLELMLTTDVSADVRREALTAMIKLARPTLYRLKAVAMSGDPVQQQAAVSAIANLAKLAREQKNNSLLVRLLEVSVDLIKHYESNPQQHEVELAVTIQGLQSAIGKPKPEPAPKSDMPSDSPMAGANTESTPLKISSAPATGADDIE